MLYSEIDSQSYARGFVLVGAPGLRPWELIPKRFGYLTGFDVMDRFGSFDNCRHIFKTIAINDINAIGEIIEIRFL
ncbi:hypothetical protein [Lyngbya sp. CCY1209]|jgi:hypothetical protein|uniref:hypothetical protein n=1 Tax=Lyngbya sp. CCY1209 TaxID=2886103 RepID=UPI002D203ED4|nr:hypothetical protein [Lyngbya sp. CCY1209]MEB3885750.1 hypothetical protein [Lyngbya sp. CCY1209]